MTIYINGVEKNYLAPLTLPAIRKLTLTDLGTKFTASDIDGAITSFEDCAVIKAHDGDYYLFLDDHTVTNHDVWCVKSSTPTFDSYTVIGKVITRADTRVMGVVYDEENEEYILYLSNKITKDTNAFYIAKAAFPDGAWNDAGIVLSKGSAGSYDASVANVTSAFKVAGLYFLGYVARVEATNHDCWALAYSSNPRGTFTKHPANPIYHTKDIMPAWVTGMMQSRAVLPLSNGYLQFFEGSAPPWKIGALLLDSSLTGVYEIQGSPLTGDNFANPNSVIVEPDLKKAYLYFQEWTGAAWEHQHVAEIDLEDLAMWGEIS